MGEEATPYYNPPYNLGGWGIPPLSFINHLKNKTMNSYRIISGGFTTAGNFSGYTALGKRVHIFKRQMDGLGWSTNEEVKFPFYAIAEEKAIGKLDSNRQPVLDEQGNPVTEQRLTATALFDSKDAITEACVEEATLGAEIKASIAKQATSKGLTQSVVDSLVAAF